jgi:hypothetical protein
MRVYRKPRQLSKCIGSSSAIDLFTLSWFQAVSWWINILSYSNSMYTNVALKDLLSLRNASSLLICKIFPKLSKQILIIKQNNFSWSELWLLLCGAIHNIYNYIYPNPSLLWLAVAQSQSLRRSRSRAMFDFVGLQGRGSGNHSATIAQAERNIRLKQTYKDIYFVRTPVHWSVGFLHLITKFEQNVKYYCFMLVVWCQIRFRIRNPTD